MRYDLSAIVRRTRNPRRRQIVIRPSIPPQALATNLYVAAYRPIITKLEATLERLTAAYTRSIEPRDHIADALIDDLQALLASLSDDLQRLVIDLTPTLRQWAVRTEAWQREKFRGAVLSATGVDISTILLGSGQPQSVADTIAWNVALMKDVSAEGQRRIANAIFAGVQGRLPARDVAAQLREAAGLSRQRSIRIASDQMQKLTAALDQERQQEAGGDKFVWRHSRKRHPRAEHIQHDGKTYAWGDPPMLNGKPDKPGLAPFCGCRAQMVVEFE